MDKLPKEFDVELPKWPALTVQGKRVTEEQAEVILIQTLIDFYWGTNDRDFERQLKEAVGGPEKPDPCIGEAFNEYWDAKERYEAQFGLLSLEYLSNHRVVSAYIGGPHGWCDWAGNIFQAEGGIGKWPSCVVVFDEWKRIAERFPFLELTAQLHSDEICRDIKPVIQYDIKDGVVTVSKPEKEMALLSGTHAANFIKTINNFGRERGCSIEQFKEALQKAKEYGSGQRVKG